MRRKREGGGGKVWTVGSCSSLSRVLIHRHVPLSSSGTPCINCAGSLDFFARDGANDPPPSPAPSNRKRCPSCGQCSRPRSSNQQPATGTAGLRRNRSANQTSAITSLDAAHGKGRHRTANGPGVSQPTNRPTRRQRCLSSPHPPHTWWFSNLPRKINKQIKKTDTAAEDRT
ncbi:hypothetical protein CGRA01v4_13474 [Colletotrichum graminicola]|nr:hypothetical protein CGRA01v4_13474 [Colletotrichum graminicola]